MTITVLAGTNKDGSFGAIVGAIESASDVLKFENFNIIKIEFFEALKEICPSIEQQNDKGFISIRWLKNAMREEKLQAERAQRKYENMAYVELLLKNHKTNINNVIHAINALSNGLRMSSKLDAALNAIEDNQKTGTGNWFCFIEYAETIDI